VQRYSSYFRGSALQFHPVPHGAEVPSSDFNGEDFDIKHECNLTFQEMGATKKNPKLHLVQVCIHITVHYLLQSQKQVNLLEQLTSSGSGSFTTAASLKISFVASIIPDRFRKKLLTSAFLISK